MKIVDRLQLLAAEANRQPFQPLLAVGAVAIDLALGLLHEARSGPAVPMARFAFAPALANALRRPDVRRAVAPGGTRRASGSLRPEPAPPTRW